MLASFSCRGMATARLGLLLLLTTLSLSFAGAQRKLAQSTGAPAPAGPSIVQNLLDVLGRNQSIGPQLYKTTEAAVYTSLVYANDTSTVPLDDFLILPLSGDGQVLVAWVDNSTTAVLAWRAANNATAAMAASSVEMSATSFLGNAFANATVNNATLDPFQQALQGSPDTDEDLATTITRLSNGPFPRRVLCTGLGGGGAYATLCAVWAAVTFPLAQIRHITFGAPAVGDELFNWSVEQLVDLSYPWSTPGDTLPTLPLQLPLPSIIMYLQDNSTRRDTTMVENSLQYYVSALIESIGSSSVSRSFAGQNSTDNNSTLVDGIASYDECARQEDNSGGFLSQVVNRVSNFVGTAVCEVSSTVSSLGQELTVVRGYLDGSAEETPGQRNASFPNVHLFSSYDGICAPILCKMEAAIVASCLVYNDGDGVIGPGSRLIHGDYGVDVGVRWDAANSTALIAFRGTENVEDWIQNFQQFLRDTPYNTVLENMYPGAQVHHGFLEQFQAVTDKAPNTTQNIGDVIMEMSGGVPPSLVIVTGHSLGAGLASLAAPWAALQWPSADIRCVTFGNPKPGNAAFAQAFKDLVGRQYRMTNYLDVVPELPTFNDYTAVGNGTGIWASAGRVYLQERPAMPVDQLTWDDHSCSQYQGDLIYATAATIPTNVLALNTTS